jgi:hypothetical protein
MKFKKFKETRETRKPQKTCTNISKEYAWTLTRLGNMQKIHTNFLNKCQETNGLV